MSIRGMNVSHKIMALAAGLLTLAMTAGLRGALAQGKLPAANIAVVDVQFLMENADAAKNARAQTEKARGELAEKAKREEAELERLSQSIAQQRATLSAEIYEQRLRELRQKVAAYQIDMQERQGKLDRTLLAASNTVANTIVRITDQIAQERGFMLVLHRSAVISTTVDITQEILKRLNQQMPSVPLVSPK